MAATESLIIILMSFLSIVFVNLNLIILTAIIYRKEKA